LSPPSAIGIMPAMDFDKQLVMQAKITIQDIEPPIWRRILLPLDLNLAQLHEVIQAAFAWTDSHLHQFIIGGLVYGAPEFNEDYQDERRTFEATEVRLRDFQYYRTEHLSFLYEYDFGDGWKHLIEVEKVIPADDALKYPVCVGGERHRPPEDVGGTGGYEEFLEAWHDKTHEDHKRYRVWAGRSFSPEKFNIEATNKLIRSALRKSRGEYRFRLER
jgi:hypothetical protein